MRPKRRDRGQKTTEMDEDTTSEDNMANVNVTQASPSSELPADLAKLHTVLLSDLAQQTDSLLKKALGEALAPISASLELVKSSLDSHEERIHDMEEGLNGHSDRIEAIETTCTALLAENERLKNKVEDLENRSRRSNLRVVGIPEHMEGPDTVKFMTEFFEEILGKDFFPHPLIISRAHRVGPKPTADSGASSKRPRIFLVLFHAFQNKHRIITRKREQLFFRGHKVFFHEDVSAELGKKQAAFKEVKSLLYKKNGRFALIYPARLRVLHDGQTLFFETPEKAREFYDLHWGE